MKLKTHISGNINGGAFECSGDGEWRDGHSVSTLNFHNELVRFTPMYGKSWKCKHHLSTRMTTAEQEAGKVNPLSDLLDDRGKILGNTVIRYPFENSVILATSIVHRPVEDEQHLYQTRVGAFNGPLDIVKELPFVESIIPAGPGRALGYSVRQVIRESGDIIEVTYQDEFLFSDNFTLPFAMTISISGDDHYDSIKRVYSLDAIVELEVSST